MTTHETSIAEHLYKVLVIGDFGVGKTSIIKRYTEGTFSPNYKLTIGVDFCMKTIDWNEETKVNLQLWDIAGHERFGHMTRVYYKYAYSHCTFFLALSIAAIIMFDLSRPATFDSVLKWSEDVNQKVMLANEQPIPVLLLANKCDVEDASVDDPALNEFCDQRNFLGWFATSAKHNVNVDEAMHFLVENILKVSSGNTVPDDHIALHQDKEYFERSDDENKRPSLEAKSRCCRS